MARRNPIIVVLILLFLAFACPGCRRQKGSAVQGADTDGSPRSPEGVLKANASRLKSTVVTPHLEEPIVPGKNVLWCLSFQLAWDELRALGGGTLRLEPEPAMAKVLNKRLAGKEDIDEASVVARAGWVKEGIFDEIRAEIARKFGPDVHPELHPNALAEIFAYALLLKELKFALPFEPVTDRVVLFGDEPVKCFGWGEDSQHPPEFYQQLVLLHMDEGVRARDTEIVVELKTKSPDDRLILAMVPPRGTLKETIDGVLTRVAKRGIAAEIGFDELAVPKMNFEVHRTYGQILGCVVAQGAGAGNRVIQAEQTVRFTLDEHGAVLRSEAAGSIFGAPPKLIFDRPFLLMLKRTGAKMPYFAVWIDNAELLVPESPRLVAMLGELRFDEARDFSEGLAAVHIGDKWGFIDETGRMAITPQFDFVGDFHDGRARAASAAPPSKLPEETPTKKRVPNGTVTVIEKNGVVTIIDHYEDPGPGVARREKMREAMLNRPVRWGFIDRTGKWVVPGRFSYACDFSDGRAAVCVGGTPLAFGDIDPGVFVGLTPDDIDGKWGYIDTAGRTVIEPKYGLALPFERGLAVVATKKATEDDDLWIPRYADYAFIDRSGKMLGGRTVDDAEAFSEGLAAVHVDGKGWGFIDRTGRMVIAPRFGEVEPFRHGYAIATLDGRWGFVDREGNFRAWQVQGVMSFDTEYSDGRMLFSVAGPDVDGEVYGFFGMDGGVAIAPTFAQAETFSEGLAAVYIRNEGWGYIDAAGKTVIPPMFGEAGRFHDGLAAASTREGKRWGVIDRTGKWVIRPKFDQVDSFVEGLASVTLDGKVGFIDRTGKMVIANEYSIACDSYGGFARVALQTGTDEFECPVYRWGFVDRTGKMLEIRGR